MSEITYDDIPHIFCNRHDDIWFQILKVLTCGTGLGIEQITPIDSVAPNALTTIPPTAKSALVVIETDGTETNPNAAVRFSIGSDPDAAVGIPLGNTGNYRICGPQNLPLFRIIATDGGTAHTATVLYFD